MEVRNCKGCGKLFNYMSGPPICPSCADVLDLKFEGVKEYVYDHPGVGIQELSVEMEVPVQQIKQWIRDERLSFAEDSMMGLACEGCGVTIKTGRYCKLCKDKLTKGLTNLYAPSTPATQVQKEPREKSKMTFYKDGIKREL
jgi:hypothetical protein